MVLDKIQVPSSFHMIQLFNLVHTDLIFIVVVIVIIVQLAKVYKNRSKVNK